MQNKLILLLSILSLVNFISSTIYTCNQNTSCGCSSASTVVTSRIVGGEIAQNDVWNWMVSLSRGGSHRCGASLISDSYAITAAHCVEGYVNTPSVFTIMVGTNYLYDTTSTTIQRRTVTTIIIHPNYNTNTEENDIAILVFSPLTVSANSKISFICLPESNIDPFETGTSLVATGWGYTNENGYSVSSYLQQVTVQVFSSTSADCIRGEIKNSAVQFCAGVNGGGKDTCQGDSGGPLIAFVNDRWVLAGITSYGIGCARNGYPGVYTRVSALIPFINTNTGVYVTSIPRSSSSSTSRTTVQTSQSSSNFSIIEINHGENIGQSMTIMAVSLFLSLLFYSS